MPGRRDAPSILDPSQLYIQVHESCGHPTELDRVFGTEASYAGTSFLTTDKLDEGFRYGSDLVTIVADATSPGGMGTFGWDDEGVAAQAVDLVRDGIFVGYLTSRETAPRIGRASGGAMRADGWNRIPLIRMTNISLLPVPGMSLDDIVADTDDGLYLTTNRSWSIDDRRLNFQFATEVAYEIKGGKLGRLFRNPTYTGITYEFWRSCDAVGDASSWVMLGTPNCGKGEPSQLAPRRARRLGGPVPERPGGGRQVVSTSRPEVTGERAQVALALADDVVARALAAGATEAEALVTAEDAALTRFANSEIHQNVAETNIGVNLRFCVGRRIAVAATGRTDDDGLRALVERAATIAASVEELEDWGGLPGPDGAERSGAIRPAMPRPRRGLARVPGGGRPGGHRRRRCGRGPRLRLVLDHRARASRSPTRPASARPRSGRARSS